MNFFAAISVIITVSALLGFINHKWLKLPSAIGVMVLSLLIGISLRAIYQFYPEAVDEIKTKLNEFDFSSFVLNIILCFLLFAGSLHVKYKDLKESRISVLSYATVGVIISTFLVGGAGYLVFKLFNYNVSFIFCLLFGALISPTDPIAVIGILKKYAIPEKIKIEVVGESLFNDGVGVVVFTIIYTIAETGTENFTLSDFGRIFSLEVFGGIGLGFLIGYAGFYLMKAIDHYQTEILITLALVMGGYTVANYFHASGPLAMVIAGLIIGNQGKAQAMSDTTAEYVDKFWELIDEICNTILFVLIGLQVFIIPFEYTYILMGVLFIIIVLTSRFISLLPSYLIFNRNDPRKLLGLSVLTWGGLRGGISIALALSLNKKVEHSQILLVITYSVVLFSLIVQGLSINKLLKRY
jgi:monovalent cation:H+ antiporter, CPA1 family